MQRAFVIVTSVLFLFSFPSLGADPELFSSNPWVHVERGAEAFEGWGEPMEWWMNPSVKKMKSYDFVYVRYGIPTTLKVDRFSEPFEANVVRIAPLAVKIPFYIAGGIISVFTLHALLGRVDPLPFLMGAWLFENGLFQGISQPVVRTKKRKSHEHLPFKKAVFPISKHLRVADILRGSPVYLPDVGTKAFPRKLHLSSTYRGKIKDIAADFEIIEGPREGEVVKKNLHETKMVSPLCKTFMKAIGWDI